MTRPPTAHHASPRVSILGGSSGHSQASTAATLQHTPHQPISSPGQALHDTEANILVRPQPHVHHKLQGRAPPWHVGPLHIGRAPHIHLQQHGGGALGKADDGLWAQQSSRDQMAVSVMFVEL